MAYFYHRYHHPHRERLFRFVPDGVWDTSAYWKQQGKEETFMIANPEDVFERALQRYEQAVREYKTAVAMLIDGASPARAKELLDAANNRICYLDATPGAKPPVKVSQEEVDRRAAQAAPVVDADAARRSPWATRSDVNGVPLIERMR